MERKDILEAAMRCVQQDRQATHGKPEDSFRRIAELWSAYLGYTVDSADVAAMMALLKIARIASNPKNADNWVDLAGYAACGGEVAECLPHIAVVHVPQTMPEFRNG